MQGGTEGVQVEEEFLKIEAEFLVHIIGVLEVILERGGVILQLIGDLQRTRTCYGGEIGWTLGSRYPIMEILAFLELALIGDG